MSDRQADMVKQIGALLTIMLPAAMLGIAVLAVTKGHEVEALAIIGLTWLVQAFDPVTGRYRHVWQ